MVTIDFFKLQGHLESREASRFVEVLKKLTKVPPFGKFHRLDDLVKLNP